VKEARQLLEAVSFEGVDGKDASRILERTGTAVAAFYPEEAARRFFLAGWGSYPRLRAGISMAFSRDWKKVKSETGGRYWLSKSRRIGVALGSKLALVADGDPFAPGADSQNGTAPEGFEDFRRPCVLAGWMPEPEDPVNRFLAAAGIPLQIPAENFFFGTRRVAGGQWELVFQVRTPSVSQARALVTLFSLARIFAFNTAKDDLGLAGPGEASGRTGITAALPVLFTNSPVQNGAELTLHSGSMNSGEIALLFNIFSVYSIENK
jgi:hypothetical protein